MRNILAVSSDNEERSFSVARATKAPRALRQLGREQKHTTAAATCGYSNPGLRLPQFPNYFPPRVPPDIFRGQNRMRVMMDNQRETTFVAPTPAQAHFNNHHPESPRSSPNASNQRVTHIEIRRMPPSLPQASNSSITNGGCRVNISISEPFVGNLFFRNFGCAR